MKKISALLLSSACAALALPIMSHAESIAGFDTYLTRSNPTQLGRPSRNSVPQDWAGDETYPGVLASTASYTYYYGTFTYAASLFTGAPYLEITDTEPGNTAYYFLSAYANSYDPANRATNWLGDVGFSGNYQTNDGGDMTVVLPDGANLVLVLNSTVVNSIPSSANQIHITVDAFGSTDYGDPVPSSVTPEPSSFLLLGTGMTGAFAMMRRRVRNLA